MLTPAEACGSAVRGPVLTIFIGRPCTERPCPFNLPRSTLEHRGTRPARCTRATRGAFARTCTAARPLRDRDRGPSAREGSCRRHVARRRRPRMADAVHTDLCRRRRSLVGVRHRDRYPYERRGRSCAFARPGGRRVSAANVMGCTTATRYSFARRRSTRRRNCFSWPLRMSSSSG